MGEKFLFLLNLPVGAKPMEIKDSKMETPAPIKTEDEKVVKTPEPVVKETKKEEPETTAANSEEKVTLPEGSIHLTVKKARNLEKKGMLGKADPYTKVSLGKQTSKSKTIDNNQILNGIMM